MTDDEASALKTLAEVVGQTQALNRANSYILMEIVRDIARSQDDPRKYLANMFEKISARADQFPIAQEAHPVNAEFRVTIANFFALAQKGLQK
jgi:hypothetical protein